MTLLLSHLGCLGLSVNFAKSILSPCQRVSVVTTIQCHAASFKEGTAHQLKAFQTMQGLMAAALPILQLGLLYMCPFQFWLKQRVPSSGLVSWTPPRNGDSGLCISPGPFEGPLLAKARRNPRHGTQKECCHDRRFQQGLGAAVRGQTDLLSLVRRGVLSIFPAGHSRTPCASTLRQQVRGVIHKSPGGPRLKATACWRTTFLCGLRTICTH